MKIMDRCGSVNSAGAAVGVSQSNVLRPISVEWLRVLTLFDFGYRLARRSLETPPFFAGFTRRRDSAKLHESCTDFNSNRSCPGDPHRLTPSNSYNSWEATEFNVNEAGRWRSPIRAARLRGRTIRR